MSTDKKSKPLTLWEVAIDMVNKIYDITGDRKLYDYFRSRITEAYWNDQHEIDKSIRLAYEYKDEFY